MSTLAVLSFCSPESDPVVMSGGRSARRIHTSAQDVSQMMWVVRLEGMNYEFSIAEWGQKRLCVFTRGASREKGSWSLVPLKRMGDNSESARKGLHDQKRGTEIYFLHICRNKSILLIRRLGKNSREERPLYHHRHNTHDDSFRWISNAKHWKMRPVVILLPLFLAHISRWKIIVFKNTHYTAAKWQLTTWKCVICIHTCKLEKTINGIRESPPFKHAHNT